MGLKERERGEIFGPGIDQKVGDRYRFSHHSNRLISQTPHDGAGILGNGGKDSSSKRERFVLAFGGGEGRN